MAGRASLHTRAADDFPSSPRPCLLDGSRYVPVAVLFRDPGLFVLDQVVGTVALAVLFLGPSAATTRTASSARHGAALASAAAAVQARTATGSLARDAL